MLKRFVELTARRSQQASVNGRQLVLADDR